MLLPAAAQGIARDLARTAVRVTSLKRVCEVFDLFRLDRPEPSQTCEPFLAPNDKGDL